jgi:hypothetical protein
MSSSTVFAPLERSRYFQHLDGIATTKAKDDDVVFNWNLTDYLASAETVSSAVWVASGVTVSSKSVATPVVIGTVTGLGYTTITATLSSGRTVDLTVYFLDAAGGGGPSDYR